MAAIIKPTLIVDKTICKKNIQFMVDKTKRNNLVFRPHFKTHQSYKIADLYSNLGVDKITVSSISMANTFAKKGWNNITVAFPCNVLEIKSINNLAKKNQLNLVVESIETIHFLQKKLASKVGVFIKINSGYNRAGIAIEDSQQIEDLVTEVHANKMLNFIGFLLHFGNTYQAKNQQDVISIYNLSKNKLESLKEKFPKAAISIGDTPSCSIVDDFEGIDEIRPGNFVYYDATQLQIESCKIEQIAVIMACPVVAINSNRNEVIIYGGAVHFSKEQLNSKGIGQNFGLMVEKDDNGYWQLVPKSFIKNLSQEHGIVKVSNDIINKLKLGDLLYFIPVHSCLTANLMKRSTRFV